MTFLILGVVLWSILHLMPAADVGFRKNLIARIGENPYRGVFSLLIVLSLYLIISGWKSTIPESLYLPPIWGRHVTALFMLIGLTLFIASHPPNNFKRLLRHPMLAGVICWSIGHLFSNGELRSVILFGGMAVWAAVEILLINRRDGAWTRPDPVPFKKNIAVVIGAVVVYVVIVFSHTWLFGVSPIG